MLVAAASLAIIGLTNVAGSLAAGGAGKPRAHEDDPVLDVCRARHRTVGLPCSTLGALDLLLVRGRAGCHLAGDGVADCRADRQAVWDALPRHPARTDLFSHQVGGFLGALMGGIAVVSTGSYQWMRWADAVLAFWAALVILPVREAPPQSRLTVALPA